MLVWQVILILLFDDSTVAEVIVERECCKFFVWKSEIFCFLVSILFEW
jgi:hypothetical protein